MTTHHTTGALQARVLLNAVGGLIGFIPERSLVLVAFDEDGSVNSTMRQDIVLDAAGAPRPEFLGVVDNLATLLLEYDAAVVVAIIIDDRYPPDSPQVAELVERISGLFDDYGGLAAAYATSTYATGEHWHTVLPGPASRILAASPAGGVLADPTSSPTALDRAVRRGRPVLRKRAMMGEMLAETRHCTDPSCSTDRLRAHGKLTREEQGDLLSFAFDALRTLAAGSRTSGVEIPCAALGTWYRALTDLTVRDALLAVSITELRDPAERMWRELTRVLRGSGRASAATMLAHLHYIAGEGAFAGVALDVALGADREWSFAVLLDRALRAGVRPSLLWDVVADSYRTAHDLGVTMPEPTLKSA
ncbi:DUF4192 domain-containing protein [Gordonia sp. TBRC 11910]|uniref:DUF4192 domain-containing protein n=1 Tax=Gordonia asplenii TaxID=2725283 RepID=A0A848KNR7_9ACTN|nr:DUF4192 domain-containing protein [Gordonia asplenii]NMN99929.1 DUF4192 domain-containing protein [Gordonia asplenii]